MHAFDHLELASNAKVNGNVFYKVIEMAQGAVVNGGLHLKEKDSNIEVEPTRDLGAQPL